MITENINTSSGAANNTVITISDFIGAADALTAVLEEESGFMETMQINMVGELQDRKLKITSLLERYMRYISKNPQVMANMGAEEKSRLAASDQKLKAAMKVNYEKLLVARSVNNAIVTCVTGIFTSKRGNKTYNSQGTIYSNDSYCAPVSMTLNKMA